MDRQIERANVNGKLQTKRSHRTAHLMCLTPLWGVAGFLGCAYFAWVSLAHITRNEYAWPHDSWTAATSIVWILLLIGLALDTRCLRERVFFGLLVSNFVIGCGLTLWSGISSADVRTARITTGALWAAAALVSLTTLGSAPEIRSKDV
jgi:hypothetical protein